jgi:hypothetical protein
MPPTARTHRLLHGKATAFMSEHTAEYALVSDLASAFQLHFDRVIPLYFWSTREGSRAASKSLDRHNLRILGAYARRPKIIGPHDESILVKVNRELLAGSRVGSETGIPILIGVPLVTTLADFSLHCPCGWFHLKPDCDEDDDYSFELRLPGGTPTKPLDKRLAGPLNHADVIQLLFSQSGEMSWEIAVEKMREIRSSSPVPSPFGGGYRPFFVIVADEKGPPSRALDNIEVTRTGTVRDSPFAETPGVGSENDDDEK